MDLTLSDEQRLLRESVDRFIAETYDADHRRRVATDPLGFSPEIWKKFAELGWLATSLATPKTPDVLRIRKPRWTPQIDLGTKLRADTEADPGILPSTREDVE